MNIGEIIAEIKMSDLLNADSFGRLTNKMIYANISDFPAPKVVSDFDVNYKLIWKRLMQFRGILSSQEFDCLYLLIHNKLPVPERLYRIGVRDSHSCNLCPGLVSDLSHYFCTCVRTSVIWTWVRSKISKIVNVQQCSDWEVLNLVFPTTNSEKAIVWLIGVFVEYVWSSSNDITLDKFFGYLSFKYKEGGGSSKIGWLEGL